MNLRGLPFSLYDFLGYFVPGALLLQFIVLGAELFEAPGPSCDLAGVPDLGTFFETTGKLSAGWALGLVLAAYAIGHVLSFLSALSIEQLALCFYGQPSRYLLGLDRSPSGSYYVGLWQILNAVLLLPLTAWVVLLSQVLGAKSLIVKPADAYMRSVLRKKIESFMGDLETDKEFSFEEDDFFHPVYHQAVYAAEAHAGRMQNYVALSGFLRVLALLFTGCSWALVALVRTRDCEPQLSLGLPLAVALLAWMCFVAYVKFNRRFTLEAMMAFHTVHPPPPAA